MHITVNKNTIPFETQKPSVTSGIRIGTPAITTRGMKEDDARIIAQLIAKVIAQRENAADFVNAAVAKLCEKYPLYKNDVK